MKQSKYLTIAITFTLLLGVIVGCAKPTLTPAPAPTPTPAPAPTPTEEALALTPAPVPTPTPAPTEKEPSPESTLPPEPSGTVHQVTIKNFAFSPAEITIKVGDTVTWTEQDAVHHTTTGSIFNSEDLGQGQTYSNTFDKAGTYDYTCNYHPNMKGKVIVVE